MEQITVGHTLLDSGVCVKSYYSGYISDAIVLQMLSNTFVNLRLATSLTLMLTTNTFLPFL